MDEWVEGEVEEANYLARHGGGRARCPAGRLCRLCSYARGQASFGITRRTRRRGRRRARLHPPQAATSTRLSRKTQEARRSLRSILLRHAENVDPSTPQPRFRAKTGRKDIHACLGEHGTGAPLLFGMVRVAWRRSSPDEVECTATCRFLCKCVSILSRPILLSAYVSYLSVTMWCSGMHMLLACREEERRRDGAGDKCLLACLSIEKSRV